MFASLPLYIVTTLFAFGCVSALRSVHKQDPRNLPRVPKHDPRSGGASINPRSGKGCPQFWQKFENSCYKDHKSLTSLKRAEDKCKFHNASVVKINTHEENSFVKSYAWSEDIPKVWIGLKEGFSWSDGELVDYTHWAPDHPASETPCAWMDTTPEAEGLWYDVPCDALITEDVGTVCEKPL